MRLPIPKKETQQDGNLFEQIFIDHWEGFKKLKPQFDTDQYNEPVQKMLGCGKESNGYSEYICTSCGKGLKRIAFSCKSCFCLSCAKKYVDDFVSQVSGMLHPGVIYRHIVLTIPEQLRNVFYHERHEGDLLSEFMRSGYACLEDVVSTVKRTALKIGAIVVVQTHGRSGRYNPHLHIIMTSGGIEERSGRWFELGYFRYETIHRKWQYHLFRMVRKYFGNEAINRLLNDLWKKYPKGLVANVSKGNVPDSCRGLARYLARYVASPPIAIRRIIKYDGLNVKYWYQDHESKSRKCEEVDVMIFIGRMVQHIMPKGFKRIRYYGLEATKSYKKWSTVILEGIKKIGRIVKGVYQIVKEKKYRQRYKEISGKDPMQCPFCGEVMDLWRIWHPKYGTIYDECENLKTGRYERKEVAGKIDRGRGYSVWPATGGIQLPLFPLWA
jgi:hypothetical protein